MLHQIQRSRSHRQQRLILALGCGSSVLLHLGLIAGISYLWRSPAPVDEPIDITLVEPTEIEPVIVSPSPPLAQPPKINITNPPAQVAQPKPTVLKSVSKPIVVTPTPQSVAVVVKPISKPIRTVAKPSPGSSSPKTKAKPNPRPIQTAKINLPINTKPIVNPFPTEPKTLTPKPFQIPLIDKPSATKSTQKSVQNRPKTTPNPIVNQPFALPTSQPPTTTTVPTPIPSSIAENSPPISVKSNSPAAIQNPSARSPDDPMTSSTISDLSSPISPKAQDRSTTIGKTPTGGNIPNNDDKSILGLDRSPGGGLAANGSRSGLPQVGSSVPGGDSNFGTGQTGSNGGNGGGGTGSGSGNSNGSSGGATSGDLQCIQHCEIPKLRDLQDRDGGKDRLRIRIEIDPNGLVLAATISKSSDNPRIDAVVLEGIKQMQFKPPGKTIKGIIKANILL